MEKYMSDAEMAKRLLERISELPNIAELHGRIRPGNYENDEDYLKDVRKVREELSRKFYINRISSESQWAICPICNHDYLYHKVVFFNSEGQSFKSSTWLLHALEHNELPERGGALYSFLGLD